MKLWTALDKSNGSPPRRFYLWLFRTRKDARAHIAAQNAVDTNARLHTEPFVIEQGLLAPDSAPNILWMCDDRYAPPCGHNDAYYVTFTDSHTNARAMLKPFSLIVPFRIDDKYVKLVQSILSAYAS